MPISPLSGAAADLNDAAAVANLLQDFSEHLLGADFPEGVPPGALRVLRHISDAAVIGAIDGRAAAAAIQDQLRTSARAVQSVIDRQAQQMVDVVLSLSTAGVPDVTH